MKIIALPEVVQYLNELIDILYNENYFAFKDSAIKYVEELKSDIRKNLPTRTKKPAPKYFTDRFGKGLYYATFQKNKRTQWYAFFRMYEVDGEIYYQVRHIENNHTATHYL